MIDIGVVVVSLDRSPEPVAIFQSRANLLTTTADPLRSQASIVKAALVPLLVRFDVSTVCRHHVEGLHDAGGYSGRDCNANPERMRLATALAISTNLGFHDALSQIPESALRQYLTTLGFRGHETLSGRALLRGLLIGDRVTISTDALIAVFATLVSGRPQTGPFGKDPHATTPLPLDALFGPETIEKANEILLAPAGHANGTARTAAKAARAMGCSIAQSKTGSADGAKGIARDRFFIGVVDCDGRQGIVYTLIGSPDPERDLGAGLRGAHVQKLGVEAAARAIRAMAPPQPPHALKPRSRSENQLHRSAGGLPAPFNPPRPTPRPDREELSDFTYTRN